MVGHPEHPEPKQRFGMRSQSRGGSCSTWSLSHNYILTKQIDQEAERVGVGPQRFHKSGGLEGGIAYRGRRG